MQLIFTITGFPWFGKQDLGTIRTVHCIWLGAGYHLSYILAWLVPAAPTPGKLILGSRLRYSIPPSNPGRLAMYFS